MKKGNSLKSVLLLLTLSSFLACDKEDDAEPEPEVVNTELKKGFPEDRKKINGYLYAGNSVYYYGGGNPYSQALINAFFGDPTRDFLSSFDHQNEQTIFFGGNNNANVSVGTLSFNGNVIGSGNFSTNYYRMFTSSNEISQEAHWESTGNKSFLPIDLTIPGGFPVINQQAVFSHSVVPNTQDLVLNFSDFISGCDSVAVTFGSSNDFQYKRKCVRFSDGLIRFTKSELSMLPANSTITVHYAGFSYWNKTTNNKTFIFELCNRVKLSTIITN